MELFKLLLYQNIIQIVRSYQDMGDCFSSLQQVDREPVYSKTSSHLTVATLNYCGIAHSPFQFYFKDYEKQLEVISHIFRGLISKHLGKIDEKEFKWKMGQIDKNFKKGRYSHMFYADVGIFWKTLLTKEQFEDKWELQFKKNATLFKFQWSQAEKNTVRQYDFIMYHTLLQYAFKTESFEQAIKNSAEEFKAKIQHFYYLSFLNQQRKLMKFLEGFQKLRPDVFFIQEYSKLLLDRLKGLPDHEVVTDPKEDSLVLIKKNSFSKFQDFSQICKEINEDQKNGLRWAESVALTGADNYIFACVHLSSNEQKNKVQIQNLKADLLKLKEYLPKYQIVVGGDLNSYLQAQHNFLQVFELFPKSEKEYTTLKKRTYSQAQFHKAEKEVKESKDKIISTKRIEDGEVRYLLGGKADYSSYLPSHDHPYDHLLCYVQILR